MMERIPDHPDITAAERTGYPAGVTLEEIPEKKKRGIADIYEDTMDMFATAEQLMKRNADELSELLDINVFAIRNYGVQIDPADLDWLLEHGAQEVQRHDEYRQYEAKIDGVTFLTLIMEGENETAV